MKDHSDIEQLLHAYIDNELDQAEQSRVEALMREDDSVLERYRELRRLKDEVIRSFADARAPARSLTGNERSRKTPLLRVAASFLLVAGMFTAGWVSHSLYRGSDGQFTAFQAGNTAANRIILHIADSDEQRFSEVFSKTERLLKQFERRPVSIDIVANAGGLDLLRTSTSHHADQIRQLIAEHDNVQFVACAMGLSKLRQRGMDVRLIEGVHSDQTAANHLIRRLSEGWTYIRI